MSSKIEQVRRQYSSTGEQLCTLCCQETVAWAVPACDHALCLTCVTRLRVLCEQKECPVCRETIEKVSYDIYNDGYDYKYFLCR